jgi:hypothetical protein
MAGSHLGATSVISPSTFPRRRLRSARSAVRLRFRLIGGASTRAGTGSGWSGTVPDVVGTGLAPGDAVVKRRPCAGGRRTGRRHAATAGTTVRSG